MSLTASRAAVVAYATLAYVAFVASTAWAAIFLVHPVDDGPASPGWFAVLVDTALLGLFAIQHTVMARSGFKQRLVRILPAGAERSTYVLASSLVLGLLFWQWRPISATVWHTTTHPWTDLVWTIYAGGWLIAIAATFMLDHADFLGLKQAYQRDYQEQPFRERWLYVWVRHPMMLGLMIAFWATPVMTAGHALFAVAATGYIAIGVRFEERDLRRQLGGEYDAYATRVPALFPRIGRRIEPVTAPVEAPLHGQQGG